MEFRDGLLRPIKIGDLTIYAQKRGDKTVITIAFPKKLQRVFVRKFREYPEPEINLTLSDYQEGHIVDIDIDDGKVEIKLKRQYKYERPLRFNTRTHI